jgi:CDP-paratose 2-epimerase
MSVVIVTGSSGLIGSEAVRKYSGLGYQVVGIDNNLRRSFFGDDACTLWNRDELVDKYKNYIHYDVDIRNSEKINEIFNKYEKDISLIIHAAAQPSHDWASSDPFTDFSVNANGTLVMLEAFRRYCNEAVFIFMSTNKVYGDRPNYLDLIECPTRFEISTQSEYKNGINELLSIDNCKHSLFGASKVAADILVQEYGRYFSLATTVLRGGCLTGPSHSGTKLHGFLSYLMRCAITKKEYTMIGYGGKQVRDNIHSSDLLNAIHNIYLQPKIGVVYNIGGGSFSNCSIIEATTMASEITGNSMKLEYEPTPRSGDHIWWITDLTKFKSDYPNWSLNYNVQMILTEIYETQSKINFASVLQ